jgi:hypothetical protein
MENLPVEMFLHIIDELGVEEFISFIFMFSVGIDLCERILKQKLKKTVEGLSLVEKSEENVVRELSLLILSFSYLTNELGLLEDCDAKLSGGYCYLSGIENEGLIKVCKSVVGPYIAPWMVRCVHMAHNWICKIPRGLVRTFNDHNSELGIDFPYRPAYSDSSLLSTHPCSCIKCRFVQNISSAITPVVSTRPDLIIFGFMSDSLDMHFCGYSYSRFTGSEDMVRLHASWSELDVFKTAWELKQKESFFTGRVGSPESVSFDLKSELTEKPLNTSYKGKEQMDHVKRVVDDAWKEWGRMGPPGQSTISPDDSASCMTPKQTFEQIKRKNDLASEVSASTLSILSTQIANLTSDFQKMAEKKAIGDYSRYEYDEDLTQAFESSGVVNKDGQLYLKPLAHTNASDLVPRITIDDRLNFLVRLHTAIFKIVPNTLDYPRPGISDILRSAMEGKLQDDHPSFDLLQIVVTDTFDWTHGIIKNNNFLLPILEPGMRFSERVIAMCLLSLKTEYMTRWGSLVKDCILPGDIMDTSRWSDSYDRNKSNLITARRPDMALKDRERSKQHYRKKRKDSVFNI